MRNASSPRPSRMSYPPLSPSVDLTLSSTVPDPKRPYSVATSGHDVTSPCGMDVVGGEDGMQVGNNTEWANSEEEHPDNQVTPKYHVRYSQLQWMIIVSKLIARTDWKE